MLQHLKEKKDVGFFTSVAGLMNQCWYVDFTTLQNAPQNASSGILMFRNVVES